ncbi:MAG: hypothetical protein LBI72_08330 [Flavobacteriaceae bacterium]|jgi:hypothetical protein|nr:hypothetical protein [Flavobacteriaceae bacterium]
MIPPIFSFLGLSAIKWAAILSIVFFIWLFYRYLTGQRTGIVTILSRYGQQIYIFLTVATTLVICWITFSTFYDDTYYASKRVLTSGEYSAKVLSYRFNKENYDSTYSYYVEVEYHNKQNELVRDELEISVAKAPAIGSTITIDYSFNSEQWFMLLVRGIAVVLSALCMGCIALLILLGLGSWLIKGSTLPIETLAKKVLGIVVRIVMVMALVLTFGGKLFDYPYLILIYILYNIFIIVYAFFNKAYLMATTTTVKSPYDRKKKKRKKKR